VKQCEIKRFPAPDYPIVEALNTLCTRLPFTGQNVKKIIVTSIHPGDGKTFVAMNLMRALADNGNNVVLVDADLRRSALEAKYDVRYEDKDRKRPGLAHYLAGMVEWDRCVYQTDIEGAFLLIRGESVGNPLPLLNTPLLPQLTSQLTRAFDMVLFDTPPIGLVVDAAEIAKHCDGALLVVPTGEITHKELNEAQELLKQIGCPILGVVLNKITFDTASAKKHYYKSYYSHYQDEYGKPQG